VKRRSQTATLVLIWFGHWLLALCAQAAVSVDVSTDEPQAGVPFALLFEVADPDLEAPDLSGLQADFDIVGTTRSSHINIQNGKTSRSTQWIVSVMAKSPGTVTVPPIHFGSEQSAPLTLTVKPGNTDNADALAVLLEVDVEPLEAYVQQQIEVVARVLRPEGTDLDSTTLSFPEVAAGDAVVETLGKDRAYTVEREGHRYAVIERRHALLPQRSGKLDLAPLRLEGRWVQGSRSLFDPFGAAIVPLNLSSRAVSIDIKPAPPLPKGALWLPADDLVLSETWSSDESSLEIGSPLTRTIGVVAHGLTSAQIPELVAPAPDGLNQYADPPVLATQRPAEGLVGLRTEKVVIIPARSGSYTLPAVELYWWNLRTDRLERASLPERRITVPAPVAIASDKQAEVSATTQPATATPAVVEPAPSPVASLPGPIHAGSATAPESSAWVLLGALFGVLVGVAATLLTQRIRGHAATVAARGTKVVADSGQAGQRALRSAISSAKSNDAEASRSHLLAAYTYLLPLETGSRLSLTELAARVSTEALAGEIRALSKALYGAGAESERWSGAGLAAQLAAYRPLPVTARPEAPDPLPSLEPK
jgi:hypothetical protein